MVEKRPGRYGGNLPPSLEIEEISSRPIKRANAKIFIKKGKPLKVDENKRRPSKK